MTATTSQIAAALGLSNRAIRKRAQAWQPTGDRVRGGGDIYAIDTLGLTKKELSAIKLHLKKLNLGGLPATRETAPVPAVVTSDPPPALETLTQRQAAIMDARLWFIRLLEQRPAGLSLKRTMADICAGVASGDQTYVAMAAAANDRQGKNRTLRPRTLMNWWQAWQTSNHQPTSLAPSDADAKRFARDAVLVAWVRDYRPGSLLSPPAEIPPWVPYLLDAYRKPSSPTLADCVRKCRLPVDMPRPSYSQADYLWRKIPVIYLEKGRATGAEYRALLPFSRRDFSMEEPFDCGQIDGHSFKAYIAHPTTGAHFHPEVCAVICMRTKYLTGWSAGWAESWRTVSDAFRHACTAMEGKFGGVFSRIEADRGPGNMAIKNSDKLIGIFGRAGCDLIIPKQGGNPQGHGGVERSNQSIWIRAAKNLITYTGKDMDRVTRKKVYTRLEQDLKAVKKAGQLSRVEKTSELLMSWREFLAWLEERVWEYNNTPHSSLPKITDQSGRRRNMTPTEAVSDYLSHGWEPVLLGDELLPYQFMPHERITKIDRGEFNLHGNKYFTYELASYHGRRDMIAAFDIHDAHKVWVLTPDQVPVCQATWNGNKVLGRPEALKEKEARQREDRRVALLQKHLDMARAETPGITLEHPPELQAKRLTIAPDPPVEAVLVPPRPANVITLPVPEKFTVPEDRRERWMLWNQLHDRIVDKDDVTDDEMRFYHSFKSSPTWRSFNMLQRSAQ
jgi:putative transposase